MKLTLLCALALQELLTGGQSYNERFIERHYQDRFDTCMDVAQLAEDMGLDPMLAVSTALTESGLNKKVVSSAGAVGPLQILPKYFCPNKQEKGCDLVHGGISALLRFLTKYKNEHDALCHYNAGNKCGKQAHRYARRIIKRRDRWRQELENAHWTQTFVLLQCHSCPLCCVKK